MTASNVALNSGTADKSIIDNRNRRTTQTLHALLMDANLTAAGDRGDQFNSGG